MYQTVKMPVPAEVRAALDVPKAYLTPEQVAPILGINAEAFRLMARDGRYDGEFLIHFSGNRIRVPKVPFLRSQGYEISGIQAV